MTRCSLIVIGTELTRGIIADRHGQLVSKEMTHIGVHMSEIVAIPDDGTITNVLKALKKNNDIIMSVKITLNCFITRKHITLRII